MSSALAEDVTRWIFEWERDFSACRVLGWGFYFTVKKYTERSGKGAGEGREGDRTYRNTELLSQCVHFGVFEQLGAGLVDRGRGCVGGEGAAGKSGGEVFACVEVLEEAAYGFEVGVWELDAV